MGLRHYTVGDPIRNVTIEAAEQSMCNVTIENARSEPIEPKGDHHGSAA
jgi:hypothetical protein